MEAARGERGCGMSSWCRLSDIGGCVVSGISNKEVKVCNSWVVDWLRRLAQI
jgi:hypothetical protein